MKRIYLGLTFFAGLYLAQLPLDNLRLQLGWGGWDFPVTQWIIIILSIVGVFFFLIYAQINERLAEPTPGIHLLTMGAILQFGIWLAVIGFIISIIDVAIKEAVIAFLAFALVAGPFLGICTVLSKILLFIGALKFFIGLLSKTKMES